MYALVTTTTANAEEARGIARLLVSARLAACVQMLPITSVYAWQGKVAEDDEVLLLIKTRSALYGEVEAAIRAAHSYETPQIVMLPFERGLPAYLQWIEASTGQVIGDEGDAGA